MAVNPAELSLEVLVGYPGVDNLTLEGDLTVGDDATIADDLVVGDSITCVSLAASGAITAATFAATGISSPGKLSVTAKTADYVMLAADGVGKVFTTTGAGASVTFTLPAAATAGTGWNVILINGAAQDMVIAGTAGELVTLNDLAANSVTFSTANEEIGAAVKVICDGTKHYILPMIYEAFTATIAT